MKKTILQYIGIFLSVVGMEIIITTALPSMRIDAAPLQNEDFDKIEVSELSENFDFDSFDEMVQKSNELAQSCNQAQTESEDTDSEVNLLDYFNAKVTQETNCLIESRDALNSIKNEKEVTQILETYRMLNRYFNLINKTLEDNVKEVKETVKQRKKYETG